MLYGGHPRFVLRGFRQDMLLVCSRHIRFAERMREGENLHETCTVGG